ncbi:MAG: hypothetical protein Q7P63_02840 [Verrucomicrobiota bacterium JB022]|nr:hypothetical protein [Verrucomicrobiota bacterium JB022]
MKPRFQTFLPIVHRQLQQELSSRFFVWGLVLLHAVLAIVVVFNLWVLPIDGANSFGLVGGITMLYLFLYLPLMGVGGLTLERQENRLDLILTSRLTARGIVYGQWCALLAKIALATACVAPYALAVQMINPLPLDMVAMGAGATLFASALACAIAVSISPIQNTILRWAIIVGALIFGGPVMSVFISLMTLSRSLGYAAPPDYLLLSVAGITLLLPAVLALLEVAALPFRSPSDRQLMSLRGFALYFLLLGGLCLIVPDFYHDTAPSAVVMAMFCGLPVLMQTPFFHPRYGRNGPPGLLRKAFYSTGWFGGSVLIGFVAIIGMLMSFVSDDFSAGPGLIAIFANALLLPVLPAVWGKAYQHRSIGKVYAITAAGVVVASILTGMVLGMARMELQDVAFLLPVLPPLALIHYETGGPSLDGFDLLNVLLFVGVLFIILLAGRRTRVGESDAVVTE